MGLGLFLFLDGINYPKTNYSTPVVPKSFVLWAHGKMDHQFSILAAFHKNILGMSIGGAIELSPD